MSDSKDKTGQKNWYEEKQERRRQRYKDRANAAIQESSRRSQAASDAVAGIPLGQPILVGHHSEKRHRRDLARSDNHMQAAVTAQNKADYYRYKAASVGKGGISSDDPYAIVKLKEKLQRLEQLQSDMKAVNAVYRKYKKNPDAKATIEALDALPPRYQVVVKTWEPEYSCEKAPFGGYQFSNNSAEIRRLKKRIEALEREADREDAEPIKGDGWEVIENVPLNRIQIFFAGRPADDIRAFLKRNGFRWSRSQGAWQRQLNDNGRYAAKQVINKIKASQAAEGEGGDSGAV